MPATTAQEDPRTAVRPEHSTSLPEKIKDLIRLAQEQGHLTYDDINDALPESVVKAVVRALSEINANPGRSGFVVVWPLQSLSVAEFEQGG